MPRLLWLMFQVPMSSPQMTRMFGLLPWADASSGVAASAARNRNLNAFMESLPIKVWAPAPGCLWKAASLARQTGWDCISVGQCRAQFSGIVAAMMGRTATTKELTALTCAVLSVDGEEDLVGPSRARDVLSSIGWLSRQPEAFQEEVFRRSVPVRYAAGDVIYRLGDPLGGIYGVVSGAVIASMAPPRAVPHIIHVLTPGGWTGEGPFLSREPRRIELRAALDTQGRLPAARGDGPDGGPRPAGDPATSCRS